MSEKAFCTAIGQLTEAVHDAFQTERKLPAFLLLFTSMDIVASLMRPKDQEDTSGDIFQKWVTDYLLPDSGLQCNAMDLWGARCGLLHTFQTESRKSRKGEARQLQYIGDEGVAAKLQAEFDPKLQKHIFVGIRPLVAAFIKGMERFVKAVQGDDGLKDVVYHHSGKLIVHEKAHFES